MTNSFKHQGGQALLDAMDKTISQKVAVCAAHLMLEKGATVLDAGCANGSATAYFALKNPHVHVIGVDYDADYIAAAREAYEGIPNLEFIQSDLTKLNLGGRKLDAVLNLSLLHEPYSYTGYRAKTVEEIIAAELANLKEGGVIINRDFMLPDAPEKMVYLVLSDTPNDGKTANEKLSDAAFFQAYGAQAMSFDNGDADGHIKGFFYEDVTADVGEDLSVSGHRRVFAVQHHFAWEFIWRNQYRNRFENEAEEKYAFWTHKQHREIPQDLDARVVYSAPYENPWIMENWYKPHAALYDENFNALPLPPSNFISVLQRKESGAAAEYREHSVSAVAPSYLQINSFENTENGSYVYDMVKRPGGDGIDVLPYGYDEAGELTVLAKDGYPRPIANIKPRMSAPNLDGKMWSGHMIEPIAAANIDKTQDEALRTLLSERVGLKSDTIKFDGLTEQYYYPAPSELNERVHALCVEITDIPTAPIPMAGAFSGFIAQGAVRAFNAHSLLQSAQAGMLPEARLETNIYTLMKAKKVTPKDWFDKLIHVKPLSGVQAVSLQSLLAQQDHFKVFTPTQKRPNWLEIKRSVFHEVARDNGKERALAQKELEFILPRGDNSTNVVVAVPLAKDENTGEIYIGVSKMSVTKSQYPAVQEREGHSGLLSLPLLRLPRQIHHKQMVGAYAAQQFGAQENEILSLGEGYFPSLGVMPHRIYPYAITDISPKLKQLCDFVPLREAFQNIDKLENLYLINAVYRSVHALGLWAEYSAQPAEAAAQPSKAFTRKLNP